MFFPSISPTYCRTIATFPFGGMFPMFILNKSAQCSSCSAKIAVCPSSTALSYVSLAFIEVK
ncbi:unnamed protein product [Schistosoma curassoni]|uniref:4Fe-4S ferredoxin-type domain-containing protein n=1 Tax=Schistosoma curassoni TaxID=6186 RepID=A0A183KWE9_9TREM|nr:unnamed protein product [Schistosoma curassoni]